MQLAIVTNLTPTRTSRTDTRLLKICRQYLLQSQHLAKLRTSQQAAETLAQAVLRKPDDSDPEALALWRDLYSNTNAARYAGGIEWGERRLAMLLTEISETPACTERGLRARLEVFRAVLAQDDADRLLDAIVADTRKRRA
jgi:hypothetical protein